MNKTLKWALRGTMINALVSGTIGVHTIYDVPPYDAAHYFAFGGMIALFPWVIVLFICIAWRLLVHVSLAFWIPFKDSIHHVVWLSFFFASLPFAAILIRIVDQTSS